MAADRKIIIGVQADGTQAQKELERVNRAIAKTEQQIQNTQAQRNGIAEQLREAQAQAIAAYERAEELRAALADPNISSGDKTAMTAELKKQEAIQKQMELAAMRLEQRDLGILEKLKAQTAQLEEQKSTAGDLEKQVIDTSTKGFAKWKEDTGGLDINLKKGFSSILKWGFGIRSIFVLVNKLRNAIVSGVKSFAAQDAETQASLNGLRASLAALQGAWGAAFAPIINAVAPLIQTLIGWLTAGANAVASFMAALTGRSTYKKAVANQNKLADGIAGVGGAAEEAKAQLLGFDEITKLDDTGGGGGGGGALQDAFDYIDEVVDANRFGTKIATKVKDVLFDWKDLNEEQIAEKCFAAIPTTLGMVTGGIVGGLPGIIIGGLAGLTLGILGDAVVFDGDGKISEQELGTMIADALTAIVGGVVGFYFGGAKGALIGADVGFALALAANVFFESENPVAKFIRENLSDRAIIGFIKENLSWEKLKNFFWDNGLKLFINDTLSLFNTSWDTFGRDIADKWDNFTGWLAEKWGALRDWWRGLSLGSFDFKTPHLEVAWEQLANNSVLARLLGITAIPHLSVSWYARGGIFDNPSLIGVGEAGAEAVVPLENTKWMDVVADNILERMTSQSFVDRLAEAFTSVPLPSMADGSVVPPRLISDGFGEIGSDILRKIDALTERLDALASRDFVGYSSIELDRRKIGEAVTRYQREQNIVGGR